MGSTDGRTLVRVGLYLTLQQIRKNSFLMRGGITKTFTVDCVAKLTHAKIGTHPRRSDTL